MIIFINLTSEFDLIIESWFEETMNLGKIKFSLWRVSLSRKHDFYSSSCRVHRGRVIGRAQYQHFTERFNRNSRPRKHWRHFPRKTISTRNNAWNRITALSSGLIERLFLDQRSGKCSFRTGTALELIVDKIDDHLLVTRPTDAVFSTTL